jgi:hypothetical protein
LLCNFFSLMLLPPSLFNLNIILSTLASNILNLYFSDNVKDEVLH